MKCKPKKYVTLQIMNWKFIIDLKPQQKWNCKIKKEEYILDRDNVTIIMTKEEFDKYFTIIENKEN